MNNDVVLKPFTIAPLQGADELANYQRLPDEVQALVNEIANSPGGSFLVTGYRGVGKTSFVNKALIDAELRLKGQKQVLVTVRLNLARGYSTDKLLRRLIRELYYSVNRAEVYQSLPSALQKALYVAFLRTSQQLKTAYTQGLKEVITHTEASSRSVSSSTSAVPEFSFGGLSLKLFSFGGEYAKGKSTEDTKSRETNEQRGFDVAFLEYDDEIAENDLCELIDHLATFRSRPALATRKIRRPTVFWNRLPAEFRIRGRLIKNYHEIAPDSAGRDLAGLKIVVILDEVDKMTFRDAEKMFRSLKNLFLKGNLTFVVISGKEFYYEWLQKRTAEDDIFYSLFTRIIHVPLFCDEEFKAISRALLAKSALAESALAFPEELLTHLLYRAKGTPREFFRELLRFVRWDGDHRVVHVTDNRVIDISTKLYPYISKLSGLIEENDRIDCGIKDHLRRSLHNWVEAMTLYVTFQRENLLNPPTTGDHAYTPSFLSGKTLETFNALLKAMLDARLLTVELLDGKEYYTFTAEIKDALESVDSSVAAEVEASVVAKQRELNKLKLEVLRLRQSQQYEAAISEVYRAEQFGPLDAEWSELKTSLEHFVKIQSLRKAADEYYTAGQYALAYDGYKRIKEALGVSSDVDDQLCRAELQLALADAKQSLEIDSDFKSSIRTLEAAVDNSKGSIDVQVIDLRRQSQTVLEQSWRAVEQIRAIERDLEIDPLRAKQALNQLTRISPKSRRTVELTVEVEQAAEEYAVFKQAKQDLKNGHASSAVATLEQLGDSRYARIKEESSHLVRIYNEIQSALSGARTCLQAGDVDAAEKALAAIRSESTAFAERLPEFIELNQRVVAERKVTKLSKDFENTLQSSELDDLWNSLNELKPLTEMLDSAKRLYAKAYKVARDRTVELARRQLGDGSVRVTQALEPILKRDPSDIVANALLEKAKQYATAD